MAVARKATRPKARTFQRELIVLKGGGHAP